MTTLDLASGLLDILLDSGHQTKGELLRISRASERELDEALTHLERMGSAYFVNGRWFVSSKEIVHRAFMDAFSRDTAPEGAAGNFMRELHAAGKLGVGFDDAWVLAKRHAGGST